MKKVLCIGLDVHKENGDRFWTWCFRAELYTLFRIDKSRGSQVLIETLLAPVLVAMSSTSFIKVCWPTGTANRPHLFWKRSLRNPDHATVMTANLPFFREWLRSPHPLLLSIVGIACNQIRFPLWDRHRRV